MFVTSRGRKVWNRCRYWIGYLLFGAVVVYALVTSPKELWTIDPWWFVAAFASALFLFLLQHAQVMLFLARMGKPAGTLFPALFTARRSVLNTVLPARSGTLMVLPMLTHHFGVTWQDFVAFMLIGGMASLSVSVIAGVWLMAGLQGAAVCALVIVALVVLLVRWPPIRFCVDLPALSVVAVGVYALIALGMYCVLRGLGYSLRFRDVTYLAVLLNVLALLSITPGNVGVRELVLAAVAPTLSLPLTVAILASAVFYIVRTLAYSLVLLVLEYVVGRQAKALS
jgi:uncharacterized membrane protein YbhN (UPF0104 family)